MEYAMERLITPSGGCKGGVAVALRLCIWYNCW